MNKGKSKLYRNECFVFHQHHQPPHLNFQIRFNSWSVIILTPNCRFDLVLLNKLPLFPVRYHSGLDFFYTLLICS
jgi:hypothetical protein